MTETVTYEDYSAKIIDNEQDSIAAQKALIALGFDLGNAGADGDWGNRSREAAAEWQRINLYAQPDGEISERQLSALQHQATYPVVYEQQHQIYNRAQLVPLYENFDMSKLSHLDVTRQAIIMQHAAHLGAMEDWNPETGEGLNSGAAVDQYLISDSRAYSGNAWCASYGSWALDQVEIKAGLEPSEFHQGNMRVQEISDQISRDTPQAMKTIDDYEPQGGDIMLFLNGDGTGHFTTVVAAIDTSEGMYGVVTIDGNSQDSVALSEYMIMHDPLNGKNYATYQDAEGFFYPDLSLEVKIIDISELPNYNNMGIAFNTTAAPFVPTPSSDPNFVADTDQINVLESVLDQYRENKGITPDPDGPDYLGVSLDQSPQTPESTVESNYWQNQPRSGAPSLPQF